MGFLLLQFLIWWMMLCAIRGNAHRKTNNYNFNTEVRKITWLENTHWHMLSSISVALTQKLIPHETVVGRKAVIMAKIHLSSNCFAHWLHDVPYFISPNIWKLYVKLLHTPNSWYPHTYGLVARNKHDQKLLLLQSGLWTVTEESSLLTPINSFEGGIF